MHFITLTDKNYKRVRDLIGATEAEMLTFYFFPGGEVMLELETERRRLERYRQGELKGRVYTTVNQMNQLLGMAELK